jgi:Ni,Fe-hydrogenase I small subunit
MAITRRQFVTRLGALAAAAGMGQAEIAKLAQAFAYDAGGTNLGGTLGKPRVVWIHGAECTGCSTSLLGIFENTGGIAVEGTAITTGAAAGMAGILPTQLGGNDFTLHATGYNVEGYGAAMNIADVVVDVIDLQYHETVMGMASDLAAQWLEDFRNYDPVLWGPNIGDQPFVLVVEGALQDHLGGGAWGDTSDTNVPWCSIGMSADGTIEHDMAETVVDLASKDTCIVVIPIGQCATYGGYPGCKPPISTDVAGFDTSMSQTGAMGTFDYLALHAPGMENKVVNVPGCPTNPWWFTLTVVLYLVDLVNGPLAATDGPLGIVNQDLSLNAAAIDVDRRLKLVYGTPIHGPYCPRYRDYVKGIFAAKPGEAGCLQKIGCKGPAANSLCGMHGWNNQQPQNPDSWNYGTSTVNPAPNGQKTGGHCTTAGHPCMACTEKGYPDSFVPFIARS